MRPLFLHRTVAILLLLCPTLAADAPLVPKLDTENWWTIATSPDLGDLTTEKQQPVDFAIWQAADGTWQLWSCIRGTKERGNTRLFYRWEGKNLTDRDWAPKGIAMRADETFGETPGGLQAPHVVRVGDQFIMFYGDWEHICIATSADGKTFTRRTNPNGKTGLFTEGKGNNTRDAMALQIDGLWHCYYTAFPDKQGAVFCRTSNDLSKWSDSHRVAFGGQAGTNPFSAECPFVLHLEGRYYLFRTQRYGRDAKTTVYHSENPLDFGLDNDKNHLLTTLPIAAPELIHNQGQWCLAALLPSLKGIQVTRMRWSKD
jgi:hypothetical protein